MIQACAREPGFHVLPVGLGLKIITPGAGARRSAHIDVDPHGARRFVRVIGPAGHADTARAAGRRIQVRFDRFPAGAVIRSPVAQHHLIAPIGITPPANRSLADSGGRASLVSAHKAHPLAALVVLGHDAHMARSAVTVAKEQEVSCPWRRGKGLVAAAVLHLPLHQVVGVGAVFAVSLIQAHTCLGGAPAGKHGAPVIPGIVPAPAGNLRPPGSINCAVGIGIAHLGSGHIGRVSRLVSGEGRQRVSRRILGLIPASGHRFDGPQGKIHGFIRLPFGKKRDKLRRLIALVPGAEIVFALLQKPTAVLLRLDHREIAVLIQLRGVLDQDAGIRRAADETQGAESFLVPLRLLHRPDLAGIIPVPYRCNAPLFFRQRRHWQQGKQHQPRKGYGQDPFWQKFHHAHLACSLQRFTIGL